MAESTEHVVDRMVLSAALRELKRTILDSEQAESCLATYVSRENGLLDRLGVADWQVVSGRNGSGKTHLLRSYVEATNGAPRGDTCAILIRISEVVSSPSGIQVGDEQRALAYFQDFIDILGRSILAETEGLMASQRRTRNIFPEWVRGIVWRTDRSYSSIAGLTDEMRRIASGHDSPVAYGIFTKGVRHSQFRSSEGRLGGFFGWSLWSKLKAKVGGEVGFAKTKAKSTSEETEEFLPPVRRVSGIRKPLVRIVKQLGIDRLDIVIGNWTRLDTGRNASLQPLFGELLRQAVGGIPSVSVKIGVNSVHAHLYDAATKRGLGSTRDIKETIDLDVIGPTLQQQRTFQLGILTKRINQLTRESIESGFRKDRHLLSEESVADLLFADDDTLEILVDGCWSSPLSFLSTVKELSRLEDPTNTGGWTRKQVHERLRFRTSEAIRRAGRLPSTIEFMRHLECFISDTGRGVVFLSNSLCRARWLELQSLEELRLMNRIAISSCPIDSQAFLIDYVWWHDATVEGSRWSGDTMNFPVTVHESVVKCPDADCGAEFSPSSRPYVLRGLCPKCFSEVEHERPAKGAEDEKTKI